MNYKFTDKEFNELFSSDISVKHQKELVRKAENRFAYIIPALYKILEREVSWFDYDNGHGETDGYFDPVAYSQEIDYEGNFGAPHKNTYNFDKYDYSIPISWLKDNFEESVKNEYDKFQSDMIDKKNYEKKRKEEAIETAKEKAKLMEESIKSKLTPEELCFINMEVPTQAMKRLNNLNNINKKNEKKSRK